MSAADALQVLFRKCLGDMALDRGCLPSRYVSVILLDCYLERCRYMGGAMLNETNSYI